MSVLRLYVDEDASEHAVILGLRIRDIDILTTYEANQSEISDADQLAFATSVGRTIYTFNTGDFARLHHDYLSQGKEHAGIIVIPDQRYGIGEKIRRLAEFVSRTSAEDMINRMEFL